MDAAYTAKSSQEQAVASWVDYLNQIRIDRLISRLSAEQVNLQNAQKTIHDTLEIIDKEIVNKAVILTTESREETEAVLEAFKEGRKTKGETTTGHWKRSVE